MDAGKASKIITYKKTENKIKKAWQHRPPQ